MTNGFREGGAVLDVVIAEDGSSSPREIIRKTTATGARSRGRDHRSRMPSSGPPPGTAANRHARDGRRTEEKRRRSRSSDGLEPSASPPFDEGFDLDRESNHSNSAHARLSSRTDMSTRRRRSRSSDAADSYDFHDDAGLQYHHRRREVQSSHQRVRSGSSARLASSESYGRHQPSRQGTAERVELRRSRSSDKLLVDDNEKRLYYDRRSSRSLASSSYGGPMIRTSRSSDRLYDPEREAPVYGQSSQRLAPPAERRKGHQRSRSSDGVTLVTAFSASQEMNTSTDHTSSRSLTRLAQQQKEVSRSRSADRRQLMQDEANPPFRRSRQGLDDDTADSRGRRSGRRSRSSDRDFLKEYDRKSTNDLLSSSSHHRREARRHRSRSSDEDDPGYACDRTSGRKSSSLGGEEEMRPRRGSRPSDGVRHGEEQYIYRSEGRHRSGATKCNEKLHDHSRSRSSRESRSQSGRNSRSQSPHAFGGRPGKSPQRTRTLHHHPNLTSPGSVMSEMPKDLSDVHETHDHDSPNINGLNHASSSSKGSRSQAIEENNNTTSVLSQSQRSKLRSLLEKSSDNSDCDVTAASTECSSTMGQHKSMATTEVRAERRYSGLDGYRSSSHNRVSQGVGTSSNARRLQSFEDLADAVADEIDECEGLAKRGQLLEGFATPSVRMRHRSMENTLAELSDKGRGEPAHQRLGPALDLQPATMDEGNGSSERFPQSSTITEDDRRNAKQKLAKAQREFRRKMFGYQSARVLTPKKQKEMVHNEYEDDDDLDEEARKMCALLLGVNDVDDPQG